MTQDKQPAYLSQAKHAARVTIDEDGCTAAAFTVMSVDAMSAPPAEEVDFVLDPPSSLCSPEQTVRRCSWVS